MSNHYELITNLIQPIHQSIHSLRRCNFIHLRVWKIIQVLNNRFGWILIALMLAALMDISYMSYWIWAYIHRACHGHIQIHLLIRKYLYIFRCTYLRLRSIDELIIKQINK